MRRRRKHFEISTFPFLAVLLCTMGSLILVLLVMDRKAKLAARQKAEQEVARAAEDARQAAEERRAALQRRRDAALAEVERQRQLKHARLELDDNELQSQLRLLALRLGEATAVVRQGLERLAGLRKQVEAERIRVIEAELALKRERLAADAAAAEATAEMKAAAAAAIAEVARLESRLAELKAARANEGHTFSVVPYRGKRGDDRRPVYVECTARGAVFHPDRKELPSPVQAEDVRAEVERHLARFADNVRPAGTQDNRPAYCLLLVRPDGIGPYYDLQAALRSLRIDFGYEFIDADWLLDFPDDEQTASKSFDGADNGPVLAPTPRTGTPLKGVMSARPAAPGGRQSGNVAAAPGASDGPGAPGVSDGPAPPAGWPANSEGRAGTGEARGPFRPGPPPGLVGSGTVGAQGTEGVPGDAGTAGTPGTPGTPAPPRSASAPRAPGAPGAPSAQGTAGRPGTTAAQGNVAASGNAAAQGNATAPGNAAAQGNAASQGNGSDQAPRQPPEPPNGEPAPPPPPRPPGAPMPGSPPDGARGSPPAAPGQNTPAGPPVPGLGQPPGPAGTGRSSSQPGGFAPPAGYRPNGRSSGDDEEVPRRASRLSDRDWVIFIECRPDRVILHPSRAEFPLTALTAPAATNELLAAVKKMIERRQALVGPGEVPYRPQVRFLVRPESLRTLYLAYPPFDALPVPKTRQNIAADDDVRTLLP
jgi:hypothetical protein